MAKLQHELQIKIYKAIKQFNTVSPETIIACRKNNIWVTNDCEHIHVSNLKESHIKNILKLLNEELTYTIHMPEFEKSRWLTILNDELEKRKIQEAI